MLLQVLNNENKTCDGLQIMNQNKMADSDCGLRHHYVLNSLIAKCVPIVFVCVRFVKIYGCQYNQSSLLKIDILILLRLTRFQNLGTPPLTLLPLYKDYINHSLYIS